MVGISYEDFLDTAYEPHSSDLDGYARSHPELPTAIDKWGTETPR